MMDYWFDKLDFWHKENSLVRVVVVEQKKFPKEFLGRILCLDTESSTFLLYIDDEKCVKNLSVYQLDTIEKIVEVS